MTTVAGRLLTVEHYRRQVALRAQAVRDAHQLWSIWTPGDLASWKRMIALAYPVIAARHAASSGIAALYFETLSVLETGRRENAQVGDALPIEQVDKSLAATGLVGVIAAKSRGLSLAAAAQVGFVRFAGSVSRLALNGGRDTILTSVAFSRRATTWERVTSAEPCQFCAELAAEPSAPQAFQAHDHCQCAAEPVFA